MKDLAKMGTMGDLVYQICNLDIKDAKPSDTGTWRCEITNSAGKTSALFNVRIFESEEEEEGSPPRFERRLENVTSNRIETAALECTVSGDPFPDIKWFHNEKELQVDFRTKIFAGAKGLQRLEIAFLRLEQIGIYKCQATNKHGLAYCDAYLNVIDTFEPRDDNMISAISDDKIDEGFSEDDMFIYGRMLEDHTVMKLLTKWKDDSTLGFPVHLKNKCAVDGTSVVLQCYIKGKPPLTVRWFKNECELHGWREKYFLKNFGGVLSLEIPCASQDDTGHYICEVRSPGGGKVYTSCYLQVEPRLETSDVNIQKPEFTRRLTKKIVHEGETVQLDCAATGNPAPGFKWYKDGMEIHDCARIKTKSTDEGEASLEIKNACFLDIGLYECEAHNFAGRVKSLVRLSVRGQYEVSLPELKQPSGKEGDSTTGSEEEETEREYVPKYFEERVQRPSGFIKELPQSVALRDKGRLYLEVCVHKRPPPKVSWYKDGKLLEPTGHIFFLDLGDWHGLEIVDTNPNDAGTYVIKVEGDFETLQSSCKAEMRLPTEELKEQILHMEHTESTLPLWSNNEEVSEQSSIPMPHYYLPCITPSHHLCNTEPDHTKPAEEVEVTELCETPYFIKPLPEEILPLELDEFIVIQCQIGGNPVPNITWLRNDVPLEPSSNVSIEWDAETRTAKIVLKRPNLTDTGEYKCIAYTDHGGYAETKSILHIKRLETLIGRRSWDDLDSRPPGAPAFRVKLHDKKACPGGSVKLEVVAEGVPVPEIKWYKNEEPIEATIDRYTIVSTIEGFHSLQIAEVHLFDSDCYKCEAINQHGVVSTCAHVTVEELTDVPEEGYKRPWFVEPLHSVTVAAGSDAVLKCIANGNPLPKFKWQKDVADVHKSERVRVTNVDGESCLYLDSVTIEDAGLYFCIAQNKVGRVKSCATLRVIENEDNLRRMSWEGDEPPQVGAKEALEGIRKRYGSFDETIDSHKLVLYEDEGFKADEVKESDIKPVNDGVDAEKIIQKIRAEGEELEESGEGVQKNNEEKGDDTVDAPSATQSYTDNTVSKGVSEKQQKTLKTVADDKDKTITSMDGVCAVDTKEDETSQSSASTEIKKIEVKPPKFLTKPKSKWGLAGADVQLSFAVEACTGLTVVWFKEGVVAVNERYIVSTSQS